MKMRCAGCWVIQLMHARSFKQFSAIVFYGVLDADCAGANKEFDGFLLKPCHLPFLFASCYLHTSGFRNCLLIVLRLRDFSDARLFLDFELQRSR